jgi:hypothetical protein
MSQDSTDNNTAWLIAIDQVEGKSEEHPSEDDGDDASKTRRIRVDKQGTTEVESVQVENRSGIGGWLKKIFK